MRVIRARACARVMGSYDGCKMTLKTDRSACQPKRKHRPRCGAKTRAGGTCLVRVERGKARRSDGALGAAQKCDGGYELVCDPENEAAIYAEALTLNLWPHASEFAGPIKLIGCDPSRASRAEGRGYLPELRPPEVWWPSFMPNTTAPAMINPLERKYEHQVGLLVSTIAGAGFGIVISYQSGDGWLGTYLDTHRRCHSRRSVLF